MVFKLRWFAKDMAIDLGTANTIIYVEGQGIVLNEPSVVAIESTEGSTHTQVRAVGQEAKNMLGRTPGGINVVRPMRNGVIDDYRVTEQMLNYFIKKVHGTKLFTPGPRIIICVPISASNVDRRAIRESTLAAGATKVFLLEEPMAAAIGCNLPVEEPVGSMVLDIGGGTSEIGIISYGGLVYGKSVPVGGDAFDRAIIDYTRQKHGIAIGETTSERIKKQIAIAHSSLISEEQEIQVSGQHVGEGAPRKFIINSRDLYEAILRPAEEIVKGVSEGLEKVPPDLAADIADRGIALTGGGSLISGLELLIEERTGVSAKLAEDPLTSVARGCGQALQFVDRQNLRIFA